MHDVPIEDSIDLHTFQPKEIHIVVEEYLYQALQRGFREIRIIHGRGIGVQREIVRSILEKHSSVISFQDAPDRGSTYAVLRHLERP
jgi:DNA-nicking Smr family endonuclease